MEGEDDLGCSPIHNKKISTNEIKDSISDYRDLSDQAFRRSFERDKSLLRSFGYLLEYENDKWGFDQGYSLGGSYVFKGFLLIIILLPAKPISDLLSYRLLHPFPAGYLIETYILKFFVPLTYLIRLR